MQHPNREYGPSEGDTLGTEVPTQASHSRRRWKLAIVVMLLLASPSILHMLGHLSGVNRGDFATCASNLQGVHLVLVDYVKENGCMFPPLSPEPGVLMFPEEGIPPAHFGGPLRLTCPTIRDAEKGTARYEAAHMETPPFDDQSYFYLGYAVLDDDDVEAFARAYRKKLAEGGTFDEDLVVEDGEGTRVLHRLSSDVRKVWRATGDTHAISPHPARESGPDEPSWAATDIPLLIERDVGHKHPYYEGHPLGAQVMFLRGGIQFVERGTWPMTEKTQRILAKLAELTE